MKDIYDDIVVRGVEEFVRGCIEQLGGLKKTSQKLHINKKTFSNYIYRDSIPLAILLNLLKLCKRNAESVPLNCRLGVKRDHTTIPRIIRVDEFFMRLLGYYLAEGYCRSKKKSC